MNANEICVPESALSIEGESGAVAPGGGDEVEFTGKGRVTRAEGGNVYITPTEINGQAIAGETGPDEGAALDQEVAGMMGNERAGGMGTMLAILLLCLAAGLMPAAGKDLQYSTVRTCSGTSVSNYVASTTPKQVFSVEIDNLTGATLYLLVFDSATNQLVNATPHFTPLAIPSGTTGGKEWNPAGVPFQYGVNVCLSTTPYSLTNATTGGVVTVIAAPLQ